MEAKTITAAAIFLGLLIATADKAGIFQFACGLPYDPEAGYCDPDHESMVGYLIVLER